MIGVGSVRDSELFIVLTGVSKNERYTPIPKYVGQFCPENDDDLLDSGVFPLEIHVVGICSVCICPLYMLPPYHHIPCGKDSHRCGKPNRRSSSKCSDFVTWEYCWIQWYVYIYIYIPRITRIHPH